MEYSNWIFFSLMITNLRQLIFISQRIHPQISLIYLNIFWEAPCHFKEIFFKNYFNHSFNLVA
jgi:hypothetical protein